MSESNKRVDSIARALRAISEFSSSTPSFTPSSLADRIGTTRATARRILFTLVEEHFAETDGRNFWLTPRIMSLGFSYLSTLSVWEVAQPHVSQLSQDLNESCSMAVLDESEIVYVIRSPMHRGIISLNVGSRLPAHATSLGKALLAWTDEATVEHVLKATGLEPLTERTITEVGVFFEELEEVRQLGYATSNGEREIGVRSAAAPIFNRTGGVLAAVNVSTNALKTSKDDLVDNYVPKLLETAGQIMHDIRYFS